MKTLTLFIFMLAVLSIVSCQKYPDGPFISLRSKAERVANNWRIGEALNNGSDVTSDYNKYELDLSKSGAANLSAKYIFLGTTYEYTTAGRWTFVDSKEKLSFDFDNDSADGVYRILKLEEKEMWLRQESGTMEYHFVPQ